MIKKITKTILTTSTLMATTTIVSPLITFANQNTLDDNTVATQVIDGKWGKGIKREQRLEAAGYDFQTIQDLVDIKLGVKSQNFEQQKDDEQQAAKQKAEQEAEEKKQANLQNVAKDVYNGKYGNGQQRIEKLKNEKFSDDDISDIQYYVNDLVNDLDFGTSKNNAMNPQTENQAAVQKSSTASVSAQPVQQNSTINYGNNLQNYVLNRMQSATGVPAATWNMIISRESGWNPSIYNSAGYYGLFQLAPGYFGNGGSVDAQIDNAIYLYQHGGLNHWAQTAY